MLQYFSCRLQGAPKGHVELDKNRTQNSLIVDEGEKSPPELYASINHQNYHLLNIVLVPLNKAPHKTQKQSYQLYIIVTKEEPSPVYRHEILLCCSIPFATK